MIAGRPLTSETILYTPSTSAAIEHTQAKLPRSLLNLRKLKEGRGGGIRERRSSFQDRPNQSIRLRGHTLRQASERSGASTLETVSTVTSRVARHEHVSVDGWTPSRDSVPSAVRQTERYPNAAPVTVEPTMTRASTPIAHTVYGTEAIPPRIAAASLPAPTALPSGPRNIATSMNSSHRSAAAHRPSIRFIAYHDTRSSRPSLSFPTVTRILPEDHCVIRVGRYSEKETAVSEDPRNTMSDSPVGFKSKVVSRRHCEFFYADSKWYIRDVKSSSGTFLNHIRLSQPGVESRPFPVRDGDIVQLGIDFKGGEEMIFRCVKIRIECNRGWQKTLNTFNKSTHAKLQALARGKADDAASKQSTECTICLNAIAPCQALFVAPCSHTWHYKCIRPILEDPKHPAYIWPQFLCPNCRAVSDLEADIDEPQSWDELDNPSVNSSDDIPETTNGTTHGLVHGHNAEYVPSVSPGTSDDDEGLPATLGRARIRETPQLPSLGFTAFDTSFPAPSRSTSLRTSERGLNPSASTFVPATTQPITIPGTSRATNSRRSSINRQRGPLPRPSATSSTSSDSRPGNPFEHSAEDGDADGDSTAESEQSAQGAIAGSNNASMAAPLMSSPPTDILIGPEGPMTPRNVAGPFVFDGSGDRTVPTSPRERLATIANGDRVA